VPRHTRTACAEGWEVAAALVLPALAVLCAWAGDPLLANWLWLALLALVLAFTLNRLRARPSSVRPVPVLLWVPTSIAAGALGAALVAGVPGLPLTRALEVWTVGRGLLVQGFVAGLVLGVGGLLLPLVTRGEPPPGAGPDPAGRRRGVALHAAAALVFFGSFPLEVAAASPRLGFAVRGLVAGAVLLGSARIHRAPSLPGLHRWLIWVAAWLVPAAFLLGAASARLRGAALHVLFVGGFAQIVLAVSTHLVVWREDVAPAPPRSALRIRAMAAFLAVAFGARIVATFDIRHVAGWLSIAAYAFCAALAAWVAAVGPELLRRASAGTG
jgi:uncharacterized protein involved in response to NO